MPVKQHASVGKSARHTDSAGQQHESAANDAAALAPPEYGIDFADQGANAGATAQLAGVVQHDQSAPEEPNVAQPRDKSAPGGAHTGLPANLQAGVEGLSGMSMSHVRVHYNSSRPAQLNALAYAQGEDIHVAPGQERHLPHEAWHVVQQAQGRVKPTMQMKGGVPVNDDEGLEREADVMGAKVLQMRGADPVQWRPIANAGASDRVVQRAVGFEFEDPTWTVAISQPGRKFRKPTGVRSHFSKWEVAKPDLEKSDEEIQDEKYTGINAWQSRGAGTHINHKFAKFNLQTGPKKGTLHQGVDYVIEPDGPYDTGGFTNRMDLEIVTEPFPETADGLERLVAALDDMKAVMDPIFARATGEYTGGEFEYRNFITPDKNHFSDGSVYLYGGQRGGAFKPQVTGGFDLADIPEVMRTAGKVEDEPAADRERRGPVRKAMYGEGKEAGTDGIVGRSPALALRVIYRLRTDGVLGEQDTAALQGFLSLAFMYLQRLASAGPSGVKICIPLLSRFSFASLFRQVPEDVRDSLVTEEGREALAAAVGEQLIGAVGGRRGDMNGPMIGIKTDNALAQEHPLFVNALRSFTRTDWLLEVLDGRDLLKPDDLMAYLRGHGSGHEKTADKYDKSFSIYGRGHGNTANVKNVQGQNTGGLALVENRGIDPNGQGSGSTLEEVRVFALTYFDWARSIKEARDRANAPPPLRARADAFARLPARQVDDGFDEFRVGSPDDGPSPLALALRANPDFTL